MFYSIERTLEFFPYACYLILGVTLIIYEIQNIRHMVSDGPRPEPGRGGFIPPSGDGYEYFVNKSTITYILQIARNQFRVYLVQGDKPNAHMKHDKHGQYFVVRCEDTGTAEKIIDNAFRPAD